MSDVLEQLDFGYRAAENDIVASDRASFSGVFVETAKWRVYNRPKTHVIVGRKGSGKTALQLAFEYRFDKNRGLHVKIQANEIRLAQFVASYREISHRAGSTIDLRKALASIWEFAIIVEAMNQVVSRPADDERSDLRDRILRFLHSNSLLHKPVHDVIVDCVDQLGTAITNVEAEVLSRRIRVLEDYTTTVKDFRRAKIALIAWLDESQSVLVTFDRVDTYFEERSQAHDVDAKERSALRNALEGLVLSVYKLVTDPQIRHLFQFKVFIPEDRYDALDLRDRDKLGQFEYRLRWTADDLRQFVSRRIALSLDVRTPDGKLDLRMDSTWHRVFPRTVTNNRVGVQEAIDEYLIRHSHYKPRDLQVLCDKIQSLAVEKDLEMVDEQTVKDAVSATTRYLVKYLLDEFGFEYPFLSRLLDAFRRQPNKMSYPDQFIHVIKRFISRNVDIELGLDEAVSVLYRVGFCGGVVHEPLRPNDSAPHRRLRGQDYYFYFSHIDDSFDVSHADYVVLHPIFNEELQLQTDRQLVIG